jgi:hypothetical protein
MTDVTWIHSIERGRSESADQLLPLVYEELRRLAAHLLAQASSTNTLQPTALVHESKTIGVGEVGRAAEHRRLEPLAFLRRMGAECFPD